MEELEQNFEEINISKAQIVLDSILDFVLTPFNWINCTKSTLGFHVKRRQKIIEKCENKFNEEMDVKTLVGKMRVHYNMLKFWKKERFSKLIKYNQSNVIKLSDSEHKSGSNSDENSSEILNT